MIRKMFDSRSRPLWTFTNLRTYIIPGLISINNFATFLSNPEVSTKNQLNYGLLKLILPRLTFQIVNLFIFLVFAVPPTIEPSDRFVAATANTRTLLLCETQGLPSPSIRWYKDGSELNPMANARLVNTI